MYRFIKRNNLLSAGISGEVMRVRVRNCFGAMHWQALNEKLVTGNGA
jgi:hypothetical protein